MKHACASSRVVFFTWKLIYQHSGQHISLNLFLFLSRVFFLSSRPFHRMKKQYIISKVSYRKNYTAGAEAEQKRSLDRLTLTYKCTQQITTYA